MHHVLAIVLLLVAVAALVFIFASVNKKAISNKRILAVFLALFIGLSCLVGSEALWHRLTPVATAIYATAIITSVARTSIQIIKRRKFAAPN